MNTDKHRYRIQMNGKRSYPAVEQNQPALLKQLAALKQRLARQTWQEIVVRVYADYPQYTVESELLPKIRKTQTEQQPDD